LTPITDKSPDDLTAPLIQSQPNPLFFLLIHDE